MERIGVCVICFPAFQTGRVPLGIVGQIMGRNGEDQGYVTCNACKGKGYAHYKSSKPA